MTFAARLRSERWGAIGAALDDAGVERLAVASTGLHMIDVANPLFHLTGFKSVGPAILCLERDGSSRVLVTPADDIERAQAFFDGEVLATDDPVAMIDTWLAPHPAAVAGFGALPHRLAHRALAAIGPGAVAFDETFYRASAIKTADEIDAARRATAIAEQGYVKLKELARPGLRECDLAVELNLFMKALGADDSFLMLNAAPRADAVMPSSERPLEAGDLILVELSPSVDGQFVQICRTVSLGDPTRAVRDGYDLLVAAMRAGIAQARPGRSMADVCGAIDDFLSDAGFAEFSRPPFIRRRGHGLGAGSIFPGDVAVDNDTLLQDGMVFIVHPNQFLPPTGYMMCGEPLVVGADGPVVLSGREARLDVVPL